MNIVIFGHVNSGKSTLCGNLLIKSNAVDQRAVDKLKKQADELNRSNWLTYISDTDQNERVNGRTVALNTVQFEYQNKTYKIIDTPGHKTLIREMIHGCSMADTSILILSIREGEYKAGLKGQTLEHLLIARAMGHNSLIVCVNKIDTVDWNADAYNRIVTDFTEKIKRFRFKYTTYIPITALKGHNIYEKYNSPLAKFSLIDAINKINISKHENKLIKPIDGVVRGLFIFHDIKNIISVGLKCILHSHDSVYDAEFININNKQLNFVTQKNHKNKPIFISLKIDTHDNINSNVILRINNDTIAIGILEYDD